MRINADGTGAEWAFTGVPGALLAISSSQEGKVLTVDVDGDAVFSNPTKSNWNETDSSSAAFIQNKPTIPSILDNSGNALTSIQSGRATNRFPVCGSVVPEADYKKWWDRAKKAMRETHRVVVPSKRNEPLVLRDTDLSPVQTLLADFESAHTLREKAKVLDDLRKQAKGLEEEGVAEEILSKVEMVSRKGIKLHLGDTLDLLAGRDELLDALKNTSLADNALRLQDVLASSSGQIAPEMVGLAAARQRRIYEAFPEAFGEEWVANVLSVFDRVGSRGVGEIAKMFADRGEMDILLDHIRRALSRHALGPDALAWICRERKKSAKKVFTHEVGSAILSVVEQDSTDEGPRKTLRLQNLLMEDRELIADLLEGVDMNEVRNFARKLLQSPAFAELDRKSLMARVIKAHPEAQELVTGDATSRRETLVVSWDSLEKRKKEYEDLVNKRIPGNIKEIAIARSYGDLRENFEYKAAKQMQARVRAQTAAQFGFSSTRSENTGF